MGPPHILGDSPSGLLSSSVPEQSLRREVIGWWWKGSQASEWKGLSVSLGTRLTTQYKPDLRPESCCPSVLPPPPPGPAF